MNSPTSADPRSSIIAALRRLEAWVQQAQWRGYDPFDGLASPIGSILTRRHRLLAQMWQQGVRRFLINVRPLLGIRPSESTKAMGFFARGYLRLYQTYGQAADLDKAKYCLDWLLQHPSPGYRGLSWGNHFDYAHRAGRIPRGTPTVVWTGLIGHAFLDAYDVLGDPKYLEAAARTCSFIADELGHQDFHDGTSYISYYPGAKHFVHNSSMIGASLLTRTSKLTPESKWADLAHRAVRWTVNRQLPNGAWCYGDGAKFGWVDSFHTGYVLDALAIHRRFSGDSQFDTVLQRGYRFYIDTFFGADGTPYYYDRKPTPIDIQCPAQGIDTLVHLQAMDARSLDVAVAVANWTIAHMQDGDGHFYYRKYPLATNRTATLHWGQSTMFAALAALDGVLQRRPSPAQPNSVTASR